jgi:hypothetical protein
MCYDAPPPTDYQVLHRYGLDDWYAPVIIDAGEGAVCRIARCDGLNAIPMPRNWPYVQLSFLPDPNSGGEVENHNASEPRRVYGDNPVSDDTNEVRV